MRALLLTLSLTLPLLAGCLGEEPSATTDAAPVATSAEEAGATAGPAPSAPKTPYLVDAGQEGAPSKSVTAYPVAIKTNPPREPVVKEFTGTYDATTCFPTGELPLGGLGFAEASHVYDVSEALQAGDVFSYDIRMTFTNTEQAWGEIHLFYTLGAAQGAWTDPTGEARGEVAMNFTGQAFRVADDDPAWLVTSCWYGFATEPIPYKLTATFTFAEAAVPAATPVLLKVPADATTLFVRGVSLDPTQGVNSHYRVFGPDDGLLCECALGSDDDTASFALPGPGDYVLLVDHTSNGFVSFALDAPSEADLAPLGSAMLMTVLVKSPAGPVDQTVSVDLPTTPLGMGAWVFPPGFETDESPSPGFGKAYEMTVTNGRGEVMSQKLGGYATYRLVVPEVFWTNDWFAVPFPGAEWSFAQDHHAFNVGAHDVHVKAEQMRGEAVLFSMHYARP